MSEAEDANMNSTHATPDWVSMARSASAALGSGENEDSDELLRELLVIGLGGSPYAIAVERVREIVRMRTLTRLPRSPDWLLGVVALRGEVVEVVDLRRRLGISAAEPQRSSRIIVLHGDGERVTGIMVDSVSDVYRVGEDLVLETEDRESSAVVEMCQRGDEFISILDVDRFLGFSGG